MRVTVLIYANNNNAEIKLITRFMRIHLCVFICDEVVWSRGGEPRKFGERFKRLKNLVKRFRREISNIDGEALYRFEYSRE